MWGGHTGDLQAAPPSKLAFPTASSISIDGHPQVQWRPTISHPPRLGFLSHLTSNPSANAASCLGPESLFLLPLPLPPLVPTAGVTCPGYPGSLWTGLPAPALAPTVSCPQNCAFRTCLFCSDPATAPHSPQGRSQPSPWPAGRTSCSRSSPTSSPTSLSSLCCNRKDRSPTALSRYNCHGPRCKFQVYDAIT